MPRSGLKLLEDTLLSNTNNTKALGGVLLAIKSGTLTVNGQPPDENYVIGEYLIHGARIKFDLSELSFQQQQQFFDFITNKKASPRAFATHRAGGTDASGSPAETKSGLLGAIEDLWRVLIRKYKHYGINLPIGGNHLENQEGREESLNQLPNESGEWGHMYLYQTENMVLIGIEASAPGKKNARTGETHSNVGTTEEFSAFLDLKIDSEELHKQQRMSGKTPLSLREKYNWATVKLSSKQLDNMSRVAQDFNTDDYVRLIGEKPANAQPAEENRMEKMQAWAQATKQGNSTSWLIKFFGILLFIVGVVIAEAPIPGLAQAMGGKLATMGWAFATGAFGLGLFTMGGRQDPENARRLYKENLELLSQRNTKPEKATIEIRKDNNNDGVKVLDIVPVADSLQQIVRKSDAYEQATNQVNGISGQRSADSGVTLRNKSTTEPSVEVTESSSSIYTV